MMNEVWNMEVSHRLRLIVLPLAFFADLDAISSSVSLQCKVSMLVGFYFAFLYLRSSSNRRDEENAPE
jgi:hypothetical protein